jgi:hypothetical protein
MGVLGEIFKFSSNPSAYGMGRAIETVTTVAGVFSGDNPEVILSEEEEIERISQLVEADPANLSDEDYEILNTISQSGNYTERDAQELIDRVNTATDQQRQRDDALATAEAAARKQLKSLGYSDEQIDEYIQKVKDTGELVTADNFLGALDVEDSQNSYNINPDFSIDAFKIDPASGGINNPDSDTINSEVANSENGIGFESVTVSGKRQYPTLRSFTDQLYILMQMSDIIKARVNKKDVNSSLSKKDFEKSEQSAVTDEIPYAYLPDIGPKNHGVNNAIIQCYGEPYSFVNYLTSTPIYQNYLDLKPDKLSRLQPKIRLFKEFNSEGKLDIVEIKFPTDGIESKNVVDPFSSDSTSELEEFLNGRRGYGVGIENFTFTIDGTNPVTRDRTISATLTIAANSLDDLLKPRKGYSILNPFTSTNTLTYKYYDLAMHSDTGDKKREGPVDESTKFGMINDLDFKILAEVGIAENNDVTELTDLNTTTLSLMRINHKYAIGQDGKVTLTIEYKGYIEKEFQNPVVWDCFATQASFKNDIKTQLAEIMLKDNCSAVDIKEFHKRSIVVAEGELRERVTSLTDLLRQNGKIVYLEIPNNVFSAFNIIFNNHEVRVKKLKDNDAFKELTTAEQNNEISEAYKILAKSLFDAAEDNKKTKTGASSDQKKEIKEAASDKADSKDNKLTRCGIDPNRQQVSFFFAGDLINLILKQMGEIYNPNTLQKVVLDSLSELKKDELFAKLDIVNLDGEDAGNMEEFMEYIENLYSKAARFNKLRIVLGPTSFESLLSEERPVASIGDIPIALDHFTTWLSGKVKNKQTRYPLASFLKDFINNYIPRYLRGIPEDNNGLIGMKKTFSSVPFTAYNPPNLPEEVVNTDVLTGLRLSSEGASGNGLLYSKIDPRGIEGLRPLLDQNSKSISPRNNKLNAYDYIIFHEKRAKPLIPKLGAPTRQIDNLYGIFHYQQGVDRGILKNIEFQATNIEGRREARFQKGKFNGLAQLTEVFDATVETFLDLNIYPGAKIYIDSNTLVNHLSAETRELLGDYSISEFGLGGYYIVNSVTHNLAPGIFSTSFQAQWESWQHNRPQKKKENFDAIKKTRDRQNKCKAALDADGARVGSSEDLIREILLSLGLSDDIINSIVEFSSDFIETASKGLQGLKSTLSSLVNDFRNDGGPDRK